MNAGRMRVYNEPQANAWRWRAVAFRYAADLARGFSADPILIKAYLSAMRAASSEMRKSLNAAERKAAA